MEIKINFLIHEHFMVDFKQPQGGRSTGQHIYQQIKLYSEIHTTDTPKLQEDRMQKWIQLYKWFISQKRKGNYFTEESHLRAILTANLPMEMNSHFRRIYFSLFQGDKMAPPGRLTSWWTSQIWTLIPINLFSLLCLREHTAYPSYQDLFPQLPKHYSSSTSAMMFIDKFK